MSSSVTTMWDDARSGSVSKNLGSRPIVAPLGISSRRPSSTLLPSSRTTHGTTPTLHRPVQVVCNWRARGEPRTARAKVEPCGLLAAVPVRASARAPYVDADVVQRGQRVVAKLGAHGPVQRAAALVVFLDEGAAGRRQLEAWRGAGVGGDAPPLPVERVRVHVVEAVVAPRALALLVHEQVAQRGGVAALELDVVHGLAVKGAQQRLGERPPAHQRR